MFLLEGFILYRISLHRVLKSFGIFFHLLNAILFEIMNIYFFNFSCFSMGNVFIPNWYYEYIKNSNDSLQARIDYIKNKSKHALHESPVSQ